MEEDEGWRGSRDAVAADKAGILYGMCVLYMDVCMYVPHWIGLDCAATALHFVYVCVYMYVCLYVCMYVCVCMSMDEEQLGSNTASSSNRWTAAAVLRGARDAHTPTHTVPYSAVHTHTQSHSLTHTDRQPGLLGLPGLS